MKVNLFLSNPPRNNKYTRTSSSPEDQCIVNNDSFNLYEGCWNCVSQIKSAIHSIVMMVICSCYPQTTDKPTQNTSILSSSLFYSIRSADKPGTSQCSFFLLFHSKWYLKVNRKIPQSKRIETWPLKTGELPTPVTLVASGPIAFDLVLLVLLLQLTAQSVLHTHTIDREAAKANQVARNAASSYQQHARQTWTKWSWVEFSIK